MSADDQEASREAVLRLFAEDVKIGRQTVEGDTVRVRTVTTETTRSIEETVRHETADIKRVAVGREIEAMPEITHQGDLTIVPIVKEVLVLRRQLVLVEEIHIRRTSRTEPFTTEIVLREQHAEITRDPPIGVAEAGTPITTKKD